MMPVIEPADILILSNGPGEVTTWVLPVVKALREKLGNDSDLIRISVVLSPCPNATGKEAAIALSYSDVNRVQSAEHFWSFLLWGKTAENWEWRDKGVVVFLGGDQFFTVVIGKRLGYRTVVYAEWEARWHSLIDRFGVMKAETISSVSQNYAEKFTVVGDLMSDLAADGIVDLAEDLAGDGIVDGIVDLAEDLVVDGIVDLAEDLVVDLAADGIVVSHNTLLIAENNSVSPETLPPTDYPANNSSATKSSTLFTTTNNPSAAKSSTHSLPELIALFPGSKGAKLTQGLPLTLAIAEYIHAAKPETSFAIPVAPTLDLSTLASFADPTQNLLIDQFGWASAELIIPETTDNIILNQPENTPANSLLQISDTSNRERPFIKTSKGLSVELWQEFPAYNLLSQCQICLTTVGANTAELGSLAVPMIILLPTNQLDAMRSWDGLPGLLANLPGVGSIFAKLINWFVLQQVLRKGRLFAWPNIWAKSEIVPELAGKLHPQDVAKLVLDYLENPEKLEEMRSRLRGVRGKPGAAQKLAQLVCEELV